MRHPEKRLRIHESMKLRFKTGEFYPGARLPKELELAAEYEVALGTMRSVLKLLEDEGLIVSVKGKGTFANRPKAVKCQPVTFLLPCPNFLRWNGSDAAIVKEVFSGCMAAAFDLDLKVEAVPVSANNNPDDINFSKLERLDANSRVLVVGSWFEKTFPMLLDRKCRVAGVLMPQVHDSWLCLTISEAKACEDALLHLLERGCRRVAVASKYLLAANNPYREVCLAMARRRQWDNEPAFHDIPSNISEDKDLRPGLRELWRQTHFDGLFLDVLSININNYQWSLNRNIGIPESVKTITAHDADHNPLLSPAVSAISRPYRQMGYDAAATLAREEFMPEEKTYMTAVVERQSTQSERTTTCA